MARKHDLLGVTGAETIIGTGVKLKGNIASEGDVVIDGSVTGSVKAAGSLTVGVNGVINGNVQAENISLAGRINGNAKAAGHVAIQASGHLGGDIATTTLSIENGAIFNGHVAMEAPMQLDKPDDEELEDE